MSRTWLDPIGHARPRAGFAMNSEWSSSPRRRLGLDLLRARGRRRRAGRSRRAERRAPSGARHDDRRASAEAADLDDETAGRDSGRCAVPPSAVPGPRSASPRRGGRAAKAASNDASVTRGGRDPGRAARRGRAAEAEAPGRSRRAAPAPPRDRARTGGQPRSDALEHQRLGDGGDRQRPEEVSRAPSSASRYWTER